MGSGDRLRPMAERHRRPDWVRRLNAMAGSVGGDARRLVPIDGAELMATAVAELGPPAGDFGDPAWQGRFERLAAAVDASGMHLVGRLMTKQELLRALRTRLCLAQRVSETPAVLDERIEAPVIVTGPARSGTSILFELLWLDPTLRAPLAREALHPLSTASEAEQLAWSECEQELWADVQPEFAAIHELRSDLPVECVTLTAPSFSGTHWPMISSLVGWEPDLDVNYDFHRRILQVLQHGGPFRNWLLKTPGHLMTLPALFETYPDAWVVQTHRDPARTMPSTVSTTAMVQWLRNDDVDLSLLTVLIEAAFGESLNRAVELRATGAVPDRFVDVHFQDLLRDPVSTVQNTYLRMGRIFTSTHAERIRSYLAEKPKGKFGTHSYTPEEWGFTAAGLRERTAPYIAHFQVALEETGG